MKTHSKPICKSHGRHSKQNLQIRLLLLPTLNLQTFILTILTVFGLTSFENETQIKKEQLTTTVDTTLKIMSNQEIEQTSIMSDNMYLYNADRSNFPAKLLITGTLYEDEIWENLDKEKWFGIFKNDTGFYITDTKIKTTRLHSCGQEDEIDTTCLLVETINKNNSIILITGLDFLYNRKIQHADLSQKLILPGDTLKFNYLGVDYKMYATGEKIEGGHPHAFGNHALYLTADKNGQIITEFIKAHLYSNIQAIKFAGDIDDDGFIDLLINSSTFIDKCSQDLFTTLYLSKTADKGHLLKLVGCGDF